jgi:hypothetical protein
MLKSIQFFHVYSAPYCDVDENGIKHLVLCRVIMGNMELLRPGSDQLRPSDCKYDNGVDDIQYPKYYVVWNMNINTHIYPEFVVSFKAPLDAEGVVLFSLAIFFPCVRYILFYKKNMLCILALHTTEA